MSDSLSAPIKGRILVVDDEPYMRAIISRWLEDAGHACQQAADAEAGWALLAAGEFDLATLDVNMPGRSGLELLAQIKQHAPDVEVIMLSALDQTRAAIRALTEGAYTYLLKPLEADELVLQVQKALERRGLMIEKRNYTRDLELKVRQQTEVIRQAHEETILRLVSASQYRDAETGAHVKRTGLYCEILAEMLGWSPERVEMIRLAAPMHDVGKIGIPDAILRKRGPLTRAEYEVMKTHTLIGARMLADSRSAVLELAREIALCHHERWDGQGYPRGLSGAEIPESARLLALVDVYDALTHDRVYRPAVVEEATLEMMERERGRHFDPFLYGVFQAALPELRRIARATPDEPLDPAPWAVTEVSPAALEAAAAV